MANMGLGNNVNARNDIEQAIRLDPGNAQYQMLKNRMDDPFGGMPMEGGDMCLKMCLASTACNLCCPGSGVICC